MGYIGSGPTRFNTADELTVTGDAQIDGTTLVVDSTNNRVGVNTASPATALDVTGTVTADGLTVDTNTLYVDSTNNRVGIGTTSPTFGSGNGLEIEQAGATTLRLENSTDSNSFEMGATSSAVSLYGYNNFPMVFATNNSERMRIDSSGNVGIGSTSPQSVLDLGDGTAGKGIVWGGATGTQHYGSIWSEYGTASIVIGAGLKGSTSSSDFIFPYTGTYMYSAIELDSFSSDGIKFYTGGSTSRTAGASATKNERMRIDSSGNVGIGTTSGNARLYVEANASLVDPVTVSNTNTTASSQYAIVFVRNGVVRGSIQTTNTATSYNTSSDYRLKENVTDMTGATDRLKQLNPVRFNFIADADTTVDGFLAHEVQDVVPEAITGTKDAMRDEEYEVTPAVLDDDGNEITPAVMGTRSVPHYQGIDQSKLVPLLVATIQELEARIAALEAN